MNNNPINIILISDYGIGDPAFTEVALQIKSRIPNAYVIPHSVPAFSTLNTGFWMYQIALTENLPNTYIFSNTAPRLEHTVAQEENAGEKLMYAKLSNGFEILAINAGYAFSFIKPYIKEFCYAETKTNGSQFRSRDYFPETVAKMIHSDSSFIGQEAEVAIIPDYPKDRIVSIDGYGNIKTSLRESEASFSIGEPITISINNVSRKAVFSNGIFNVHNGELVCAPGSSGYEDKFLEVVVRGGSASDLFQNPKIETAISITPQKKG